MILYRIKRALLATAYYFYGLRWRLFGTVTIGVRVMLVQDDKVLLVRHTYLPGWGFPGGGVKQRESLARAAEREAREEVGAIVHERMQLIGIYTNFRQGKSDHVALFCSEDFHMEQPTDRWEIEEQCFFSIRPLAPEIPIDLYMQIDDYLKGRRGIISMW